MNQLFDGDADFAFVPKDDGLVLHPLSCLCHVVGKCEAGSSTASI